MRMQKLKWISFSFKFKLNLIKINVWCVNREIHLNRQPTWNCSFYLPPLHGYRLPLDHGASTFYPHCFTKSFPYLFFPLFWSCSNPIFIPFFWIWHRIKILYIDADAKQCKIHEEKWMLHCKSHFRITIFSPRYIAFSDNLQCEPNVCLTKSLPQQKNSSKQKTWSRPSKKDGC